MNEKEKRHFFRFKRLDSGQKVIWLYNLITIDGYLKHNNKK